MPQVWRPPRAEQGSEAVSSVRSAMPKRELPGPAKVPYLNGDLQEWAGYGWGEGEKARPGQEWRDNEPFLATLRLEGIERGRSAARFVWQREDTGSTFPMFMTDMLALAKSDAGISSGIAEGWWIVMKRGQNYGIALYAVKDGAN